MCDFRLHGAPHVGDIGENEPKHWNPQLPVVLSVFDFDSYTDLAASNQPLVWAGALVESVESRTQVRAVDS